MTPQTPEEPKPTNGPEQRVLLLESQVKALLHHAGLSHLIPGAVAPTTAMSARLNASKQGVKDPARRYAAVVAR